MYPIEKLIPQRAPIRMVDALTDATADEATTTLTIAPDCIFLAADGRMEPCGLVEHIAQSASALAGHISLSAGATEPPVGFIGEVKKFRCHVRPAAGDVLTTHVRLGDEVNGVRIVVGETHVGETLAAETQMKIYIEPEEN